MCLVAQSCLILCDPMDCSSPGSSVHGYSPGKNSGVQLPCPPPGDLPNPRIKPMSPTLQLDSLLSEPLNSFQGPRQFKPHWFLPGPFCVWVTQLCLTLCEPMDWGSPGSSIYGISQSRILEWVAIPFVRGSSQPRGWTWSPTLQADSLLCEPLEKPPGKPLLLGTLIWLLLYVFPILNCFQHIVCFLFILQNLFYLYVLFSICYSFWKLTCSCIFLCKPRYVRMLCVSFSLPSWSILTISDMSKNLAYSGTFRKYVVNEWANEWRNKWFTTFFPTPQIQLPEFLRNFICLSFAQLWILTVLAYHLTSHYFSQFLELLNKYSFTSLKNYNFAWPWFFFYWYYCNIVAKTKFSVF